MAKAPTSASLPAEQLDEPLGDEDKLDEHELAVLRATIERGRAASDEECVSAEDALAELDEILLGR
jgi:hypothetical protein